MAYCLLIVGGRGRAINIGLLLSRVVANFPDVCEVELLDRGRTRMIEDDFRTRVIEIVLFVTFFEGVLDEGIGIKENSEWKDRKG